MAAITIKKITETDASLVISLFNQYRTFYKQESNIKLATTFIQERLDKNESVIFVAIFQEEGKTIPVGFTQLYPCYSSVSVAKNWILNDLYVEAAYRKQGIGRNLINAAIQFAQKNDSTSLQLETAIDNYTAQKLYESIGFKKHNPHADSIVYQIKV